MSAPCPCEGDVYAPECRALSPSEEEGRLLGDFIAGWGYCTRSEGHEGDHVRCGGAGDAFHELERWAQEVDELLR